MPRPLSVFLHFALKTLIFNTFRLKIKRVMNQSQIRKLKYH